MGGRGQYSIRKAFSTEGIIKGTAAGVTKASEKEGQRVEGTFGGTSDTGRHTHEQMVAEFKAWRNNLNQEQVKAIASYTNGAFVKMNGFMRGKIKAVDAHVKERIAALKSAFNHTLSKNLTVYRGTGTSDHSRFLQMSTPGGVFRDKGAFSSSISKTIAKNFAAGKENPLVMTVRLPKGYKGALYTGYLSNWGHEKELIVKPGQNWRVVKELKPVMKHGKAIKHVLIEPI